MPAPRSRGHRAGHERRHEQGGIGGEPEHRHRDSGELRVLGLLDLLAAASAGDAVRGAAGVVEVREIAGDSEAEQRQHADRGAQLALAHES